MLTETIAGLREISAGSLEVSVRIIRIRGFRSTHSSSSAEPNRNDAWIGVSWSSAPARSSTCTLSENISVQTLSRRRSESPQRVASGTAPMPACSVAPSPTRADTSAPMAAETSSISGAGAVGSSSSASMKRSISSTSISASAKVQGIRSLICAITLAPRARAASTAAGSTLTSTPRDTRPPRGRVVCRMTRSGGIVVLNRCGTSDSRHGT